MLHKTKNTVIAILVMSVMMSLWGFAFNENRQLACIGHDISVVSRSGNYFINHDTVERLIIEHFDTLKGHKINPFTLHRMHNVIKSIPYIEDAAVYRTMNGAVVIDIYLREPLIRVINNDNESFYIDTDGYMFPLSPEYSARVLIATGDIPLVYISSGHILCDSAGSIRPGHEEALAGLFELASFINNDAFWQAFIHHIYVLPGGKFELIPNNGAHIIEFGRSEDIAKKLRKLKLFYLNSMPAKGWNYYRRINLEYRNQVICSK